MDRKIEFLYQSINDIQATIRAIDAKIGFLVVVAFIPFAVMKDIIGPVHELWKEGLALDVFISMIALSWIVSTAHLFLALMLVSNPESEVNNGGASGLFYGACFLRLTRIGFWQKVNLNSTVDDVVEQLPVADEIIRELVYEKLKLTYIRENKFQKCKQCFCFMCIWLALSLMLYAYCQF